MSRSAKTLEKLLAGNADANLSFADLCKVLHDLGFTERVKGSHHVFTRDGVAEVVTLQPRAGKAKPYQVRQVRYLIQSTGLLPPTEPTPDTGETDRAEETDDAG
jgi:predicted RNA binding protein YcfA (HicA-like mRNA interferase family)